MAPDRIISSCSPKPELIYLVLSESPGRVFDHLYLKLAGRSGDCIAVSHPFEAVPLPKGSQLFTSPRRIPIRWDPEYVRTLPPAIYLRSNAPTL